MSENWDTSIRGPKMSGEDGNRIWKYQIPVSEEFVKMLPKGARIIRVANEGGMLWMWAMVDTSAPDVSRKIHAFKAGGTMPDNAFDMEFIGMAPIYIQQELMLYFFEDTTYED